MLEPTSNEALLDAVTEDDDEVGGGALLLSCRDGGLASANNEDEASRVELDHPPSPILPLSLRVLFGCNGITLALPSTALLYIVNTRVAVPLSILPAYAAVAFLPFSLKPLYAVANHWLSPSSADGQQGDRRHLLLSCLLLLNSATIVATYYFARDVPSCFVWAFGRGVTSAWAEFLLGLALLSRVGAAADNLRDSGGDNDDNNDENGTFTSPPTFTTTPSTTTSRSVEASCFQAQAAAARNVGSLLSYAFAAIYFGVGVRVNDHRSNSIYETSHAVNESDVWNLLAVAACVHVAGSFLALFCRVGSSPSKVMPCEEPHRCCLRRATAVAQGATAAPPTGNCDISYQSISTEVEDTRQSDDSGITQREESTVVETGGPVSSFSINTALMIGSLQVALVLLTVREPIVVATTPGVWWCGWIACVAALLGSGVYRMIKDHGVRSRSSRQNNNYCSASYQVGLFLLLRHAAPSCSYLIESYLYVLLREHPVVLQVLAVHGSAMSTVAAWWYGRWFGLSLSTQTPALPTSHAHRGPFDALIRAIVITTVAASFMSLTQLFYLYYVVPPPMVSIIVPQLGMIFIVKLLTTITDEWKFLPDVVLATLAVVGEDASRLGIVDGDLDTVSSSLLPRTVESSNVGARVPIPASFERDLKYGSLISCIDFGGQVGSLLTGPLIAILRMTRDDDHGTGRWVHFDRLIVATAVIDAMLLPLLLPLDGANDARRRS